MAQAQRGSKKLSSTTTDHHTIRRWAEERGGTPSEAIGTARGDEPGIIRIDFPGWSGEGKLRPISWDEWFRKFDASNLAFVYEEETSGGQRSNFNKLVARETAAARGRGERTSRRRRGARTSARGGGRREASRAAVARTTKRGGGRGSERPSRRGKRSASRSRAGARGGARSKPRGSRSRSSPRSRSR
jgi:hypothetical protein